MPRPKSEDPKILPPSFRIKQSILKKMEEICKIQKDISLSEHFEKAIEVYVLIKKR